MVDVHKQLHDLAVRNNLTAIYVFGSRSAEIVALLNGMAPAERNMSSDVDIGIQPQKGSHLDLDQKVCVALALERLFGVSRVDLVVCPEAPPFLAQEIISGELLCCTDPDEQAAYELYVLRRAGDLAPFEVERRRMILEEGAR